MYLYYQALRRFRDVFYKDHLTEEHLVEGKKHLSSLTNKKGEKDPNANKWVWELYKNKLNYLIDLEDDLPQHVLPIEVVDTVEVANSGTAYQFITNFREVRLSAEKKMSFRELVDTLAMHEHENPKHKKLIMMVALCNYFNRSFFRIASPRSFGKDAAVAMLRDLVGKCYTLNNPSTAKLALRTSAKWLVISEVADIKKDDWRTITQFLLEAADNRTTIEKPTRAFGGVGETLDVSDLAIGIFFNDLQHYKDKDIYFDDVASDQLKDRFCPMRMFGEHKEPWNQIHRIDYKKHVDENPEFYTDIIYTINFYEEEFESELSRYNHDLLYQLHPQLSDRHSTSLTHLLNTIDLYCLSQDEFNDWITVVSECRQDYYDMLNYDDLEKVASRKLRKGWEDIESELEKLNTYSAKTRLLKKKMEPKKEKNTHEDIKVW